MIFLYENSFVAIFLNISQMVDYQNTVEGYESRRDLKISQNV